MGRGLWHKDNSLLSGQACTPGLAEDWSAFFSFNVVKFPFFHFPSWETWRELLIPRPANPTKGNAGAFVLNYSDKKHSILTRFTPSPKLSERTDDSGTKKHMVCCSWVYFSFLSLQPSPFLPPEKRSRTVRKTQSHFSVCLHCPPLGFLAKPLVSLSHTLLITAMAGPLSHKNVFFHMFARSYDQSDIHVLIPWR